MIAGIINLQSARYLVHVFLHHECQTLLSIIASNLQILGWKGNAASCECVLGQGQRRTETSQRPSWNKSTGCLNVLGVIQLNSIVPENYIAPEYLCEHCN